MSAKKQARSLVTYKSYSFIDKDPIIDQVRTLIADEGESYLQIHDMSGVSVSTLYNWFRGETRRPQYASVMAVVRSLGYDLQIVRAGKPKTASIKRKRGHHDAGREA